MLLHPPRRRSSTVRSAAPRLVLLTVVVLAAALLSVALSVLGASVLPTHRDARTGERTGIGLANTRRPGGGRAVPLPPAHLMTSPIPVPRGRKGSNGGSISSSFEYDAEQFAPLTWFAPVLSGGGYCSEALAFAQALYPFFSHHDDALTILIGSDIGPPKQKKSKLRVVQHGDGVNGMFLRGLDEYTRDLLMKELLLGPPSSSSSDAQFGGVAVCHSEPGAWDPAHYETSLCPPPQARWKIGRTMFETDRLPSGWSERLNRMDRVWVPTEFARGVFERAGVEPAKIRVVPEPVDSDFFSPDYARQLHALPGPAGRPFVFPGEIDPNNAEAGGHYSPRRPFRFLSVFKFEERKNWKGLIGAFMREFSADSPPSSSSANKGQEVVLYILTSAYHTDAAFDARIREFVSTMSWGIGAVEPRYLPPVRLLKSDLPATELVKLYAAVDCVVLPSRGEGWGRPHVEAMSMGLPLIATRWSGPEAFMTAENSFPLRHEPELVEVTEGAFRGHKWAQPSQEHLRELMRLVVSEPDLAAQRGAQGRRDMQRHFCPRCVARIVLRELADLQGLKPVREVPAEEDFGDEEDDAALNEAPQLHGQEHHAETTSARGSRRDEL